MLRWLGIDVSELLVDEVPPLVEDALAMRDLDVGVAAEAIGIAFGGRKE